MSSSYTPHDSTRGAKARPILGWLLIILAAASLLITLVGGIQLLMQRGRWAEQAVMAVRLTQQTLTTTNEGLDQAEQALKLVTFNLGGLQGTVSGIADTVDGLRPAVTGISDMTQGGIANSIKAAQTALVAAQAAATKIDDFFAAAAGVPLLGDLVARNRPEVPLGTALGRVGQSLNAIPTDLGVVGESMAATSGHLGQVSGDIRNLGAGLKDISVGLTGAQKVIDEYRAQIVAYQTLLKAAEAQLPAWMWALTLAGLFALFWLGMVQIFTLLKGLEWATGRRYL